ncbi:hypothetical protein Vretimale_5929, partial [Volvox reticuliferus]
FEVIPLPAALAHSQQPSRTSEMSTSAELHSAAMEIPRLRCGAASSASERQPPRQQAQGGVALRRRNLIIAIILTAAFWIPVIRLFPLHVTDSFCYYATSPTAVAFYDFSLGSTGRSELPAFSGVSFFSRLFAASSSS